MAAEVVKVNGATEGKPREVPMLRLDRAYCAEQKVQNLLVIAPPGLKAEEVGLPIIWQGLAKMLQPYSRVDVVDDDDRWLVEVMVRGNLPGKCSVVVLRTIDLPARDASGGIALPENVKIRLAGPATGWLVERTNPDGTLTVMGKGTDHPEWRSERDVHDWYWSHAAVRQTVAGQAVAAAKRFAS